VKAEHAAGARVGFEAVGEEGLHTRALIEERQRADRNLERARGPGGVVAGLCLDVGQRLSGALGLDHPDERVADEQQVVGGAGTGLELPDRHTRCGAEVHGRAVLDLPPRRGEHRVDLATRALLRVVGVGDAHAVFGLQCREDGRCISADQAQCDPEHARHRRALPLEFPPQSDPDRN
jgi:hypothetical protein